MCNLGCTKAREMAKEWFQQEMEKELTGRETEPWEVYFKLYKSQMPVVEQAIGRAALTLGTGSVAASKICSDIAVSRHIDSVLYTAILASSPLITFPVGVSGNERTNRICEGSL